MRAFAGYRFTDEDIAMAERTGYFEAAGRYVPNLFSFFKQLREYEGPLPDDPAVLGAIAAPVLVLHGADTKPFLVTSARHETHETHETGSIRVQMRDQTEGTRASALRASPRNR